MNNVVVYPANKTAVHEAEGCVQAEDFVLLKQTLPRHGRARLDDSARLHKVEGVALDGVAVVDVGKVGFLFCTSEGWGVAGHGVEQCSLLVNPGDRQKGLVKYRERIERRLPSWHVSLLRSSQAWYRTVSADDKFC